MISHANHGSSDIRLHCIDGRTFDLVIIGAGVAGASAALLSSQRGLSVLLVDSQAFPRDKVCGGCLNQRAQTFLKNIGLYDQVISAGAIEIDELQLRVYSRSFEWTVPSMLSVRRWTLDQMLVKLAERSGTVFAGATRAKIQPISHSVQTPNRVVALKNSNNVGETASVQAKAIIVATGLSRASLPESEDWPASVMNGSRVGVHSLILRDKVPKAISSHSSNSSGRLHMLVGSIGYLGICETDGGLVDLAAALDPIAIRDAKCISGPIQQLLDECDCESSFVEGLEWQSTPHLTRQSEVVAKDGVFLLGDATGYVEPFTGEGMSWAFKGAEALVPLLLLANKNSNTRTAEKEWNLWIMKHRNHRQRASRWVARQSRHAKRAHWILRACEWLPPIRNRLLRSIMT